ncbi:putative phosphoglycerate mutase [Frankia canadensis]|uniref:Putative phosphoglycerate mutase n=1 Tax=Frankia canadensis TaxID=1836972 RepID=A0A2I2KZ14_9ACTN|nr:histidine phosphatase family protein [Frankia canadensis]SNQ50903.1 putative phosphoglycerate mutase [Frankia canadensis]SOU58193.1 putative phosphoglycerate mutase [Frankia canadensis]
MRLMLLRHGQTPHNIVGALDTTRPGAELTALGHAQARAVPDALRGERISAIHASVLIRTQLTAAPLAEARGLAVSVAEGIEEVSAGELELRTDRASVARYIGVTHSWIDGDLDRVMPGGSSGHEFLAGYDAAIAAIAAAWDGQGAVLVVSHGAAIRAWVAIRAGGVGTVEDRWLANTGMVTLDGDPLAGWNLVRWHAEPLGGSASAAVTAHDVTGAPIDEAESRATG